MRSLFLIPARGGSKGIPGKNIKQLGDRPLITYTLDAAREVASPGDICVSTDSKAIIRLVREYGLDVPFIRPAELSTDTASSYDVVLHAIGHYERKGIPYDAVVLLQPTSPFRNSTHIREAVSLYMSGGADMVVSVSASKANPYFNLYEEDTEGFLLPSKTGFFSRRQDCPAVYEYNGAIYIMNTDRLRKGPPGQFKKVRKYLMNEEDSLDIDTAFDWTVAESLILMRKKAVAGTNTFCADDDHG